MKRTEAGLGAIKETSETAEGLKARDPAGAAQQVLDHARRNAQSLGYLEFILRQSRKDRCFTLTLDFGKLLWINHHSASYGNQISSHFDRPLSVFARFNPPLAMTALRPAITRANSVIGLSSGV